MAWILDVRLWTNILYLLSLIKISEEACEVFKKSVTIYRVERVLYKYLACVNITADSDLHGEILSKIDGSSQYLEITNSSSPEITREMFQTLNLTQITIEAKVQIIQERTFERANISNVILDNNEIKKVKDNAFKSFAIYVLNMKNNSLSEITKNTFTGLVNLRKLSLQNNFISNIQPDSFNDLSAVNELNLASNRLSELPAKLFNKMRNLQTIYLNNNYMKQFPADIFTNNNILQYLSIQNNYLNLLDATTYPQSLLYINAAENHLKVFNMSGLTNLDRIILDSNKLTSMKKCLDNLPSLSFLHLNHNFLGVSIVNESLEHLGNLSIIEIDNNHLQKIDFGIFRNLGKLEGVSLAENNLTVLDLTESSTSIKLLNLTRNCLFEIKNLGRMSNLLKLELSYNNFQEVSFEMLTNLYNLQHIWLHHNTITKLYLGCFRDLKSVTELNLSHNKITNISAGIFNGLNNIIDLDISYNNLGIFDEDVFHNTKNIRYLNIAYNNLSNVNIRRILSHTIWLREINLNGNDWTCKLLVDIVHDNKIVALVGGNSFNVSNVYGIPCNNTNEINEKDKIQPHNNLYLPDILEMMNSTKLYVRDVSIKMTVINTVIIFFLLSVCVKFVYAKYSSKVAVAKQFLYKPTANEHEIQLL